MPGLEFSVFQKTRDNATKEVYPIIAQWARENGATELTVGQLASLSMLVERLLNLHMGKLWEACNTEEKSK